MLKSLGTSPASDPTKLCLFTNLNISSSTFKNSSSIQGQELSSFQGKIRLKPGTLADFWKTVILMFSENLKRELGCLAGAQVDPANDGNNIGNTNPKNKPIKIAIRSTLVLLICDSIVYSLQKLQT